MIAALPITVSVVIPCYNSAALLPDTLQSVGAQTLREMEIVLVDDGSVDDTRAVIERLIASNASCRMTLVTQANAGVGAARNRGIVVARGRYILPLDADDLIAPTMLAACARLLDDQPETALVFTDRQDFGDLTGVWAAGLFEVNRIKYFNQLSYCTMFRRTMWEAIGGYRINVSGFADWDFWVAAAARGFRGHHLPAPLLLHRRHPRSHLPQIVGDYERLFATIILNNREVYSAREIEAAGRFLATGEPAALLRISKLIFAQHYPQ
jgi:glycosyltransferase involved in cell wall biosynthesis